MDERPHSEGFAKGMHGMGPQSSRPEDVAAYNVAHSHVRARERREAEAEAERKRRELAPRTHRIPLGRALTGDDLKQIDAFSDWYFDTDTVFGRVNAGLGALGGLSGLVWGLGSFFFGGFEPMALLLTPVAAILGALVGSLALVGAVVALIVWIVVQVGGVVLA